MPVVNVNHLLVKGRENKMQRNMLIGEKINSVKHRYQGRFRLGSDF